jgi:hypothetical protein
MHNCDQAVCMDNLTEELSINNLTKEYACIICPRSVWIIYKIAFCFKWAKKK